MLIKSDYRKFRERLLPLIWAAERRNGYIFAEQVDNALLDSRAFLFLCDGGFFVLQPTMREGVVWVNIMFAHSLGGCVLAKHMREIHKLTRQIGGRGIELYTAVKRLPYFLERQGFNKDSGDERMQHWVKAL